MNSEMKFDKCADSLFECGIPLISLPASFNSLPTSFPISFNPSKNS